MRRMNIGNGVLTTNLGANGQKSEANGQVMDSEWTANGRRMDTVHSTILGPFLLILDPFSSYPGNHLAPEQKCAKKNLSA